MNPHRNARTTPYARALIVERHSAGELLHLDIKSLGRFDKPGYRAMHQRKGNRNKGAGWDCVHVAIDDATRLT